jgi:hypothetical protein
LFDEPTINGARCKEDKAEGIRPFGTKPPCCTSTPLTNVAAGGLSEAKGVQRGVRHGQTKKAGEMRRPFVRSKYSALEDQS